MRISPRATVVLLVILSIISPLTATAATIIDIIESDVTSPQVRSAKNSPYIIAKEVHIRATVRAVNATIIIKKGAKLVIEGSLIINNSFVYLNGPIIVNNGALKVIGKTQGSSLTSNRGPGYGCTGVG